MMPHVWADAINAGMPPIERAVALHPVLSRVFPINRHSPPAVLHAVEGSSSPCIIGLGAHSVFDHTL